MELIKKNIHMDRLKCKAATQITLEDDRNVSDNKPDIEKLIFDRGTIQIEEMKAMTDHVQVNGNLLFSVLYLSGEPERNLCVMEGSLPFREQVYMQGVQSGDSVSIQKKMEDLSIGQINSRKLSVQAVLSFSLSVEELADEETAVDIMRDEGSMGYIEYRKKPIEVSQLEIQKKDIFRIKEEVQLPQNFPNIFELLWDKVCINDMEFKAMEEKISLQGEVAVFFLYEGEGEDRPKRWYETAIPFSGVVDCHGCLDNFIPNITFEIGHLDTEVRPDFDGEERVFGIEMVLDLNICLYHQEQVDILSDVYGISKEVNAITKMGNFKNLLVRNSGKSKIADHIRIQSGSARMLQLCHSMGEAQVDEINIVDNGIEVEGNVLVKVLYITNDDTMPFFSAKGNIPFQYRMDVQGIHKECDIDVQVSVEQLNTSMIDSEELDVSMVLHINAIVFSNPKEMVITDIQVKDLDAEKVNQLPGIVVYVAKEGDSLWQIGKKYYLPVEQIRESNGLTTDMLKPGDKLLLVKSLEK